MAEKHEKQKSVSKKRKLAQMLRLFKRGHKSSHSKKTERSVSDIPVLLKRIDELEGALKNAVRIRKRYRRKIRDQQQTIEELNAALKNPQNVVYDEDERPSEWEEAVAKRALEIIRREKLLEQPVKYKELKELNKYFESSEAKLEPMVMRIMDKALTFAVDELLSRQQNAKGGTVDNEMRLFLVDKNKAKRILLTVMTTRPEYLPESWGGDAARRRPVKIPEKKVKTKDSGTTTGEKSGKSEKNEKNSFMNAARQFVGYIFDESDPEERSVELDNPPRIKSVRMTSKEVGVQC
ncbi:hypothetical protein Q1695_004826 [Nippostrongylus brasiliensis]|nr:hypothetical protein Q1695_004826 [Nippostrongylus brasiliensis]